MYGKTPCNGLERDGRVLSIGMDAVLVVSAQKEHDEMCNRNDCIGVSLFALLSARHSFAPSWIF